MTSKQRSKPVTPRQNLLKCCVSSSGIAVAVVDASAIIQGGNILNRLAARTVTVPEVLAEIRDSVTRHGLSFIPFTIESIDPSPQAISKVIKFARGTGDLQTLSDVDIKLIALTYALELEFHGPKHIRESPPSVQTVNVRRLPETDLPGWGSNTPNLEEWEALEGIMDVEPNGSSRILPLNIVNLNSFPNDHLTNELAVSLKNESWCHEYSGNADDTSQRSSSKKNGRGMEGRMAVYGISSSQDQLDSGCGEWVPAVSRSAHRRHTRRKARHENRSAFIAKMGHHEMDEVFTEKIDPRQDSEAVNDMSKHVNYYSTIIGKKDENISMHLQKIVLQEASAYGDNGEEGKSVSWKGNSNNSGLSEYSDLDSSAIGSGKEGVSSSESGLQAQNECSNKMLEDDEKNFTVGSLPESTVACITSDFAMQNVLLQMGLRLFAPRGMQIHQLKKWVLKCHACYSITAEVGRIFCPKCGNGGTLRKVAVTVGENGVTVEALKARISLRGTKYSLPLPQGGRDGITKNMILREDQLPHKLLYPKTKKKSNKEEDGFFSTGEIFCHHTGKKAPFQPPVRQALAVFSGRRNPNDNHFSRNKRK